MKLLVIVICLIYERFIAHVYPYKRFFWFGAYCKTIDHQLSKRITSPWIILISKLTPILVTTGLMFYLLDDVLFGFLGLLLNILIFYYCIGPENPFYPVRVIPVEQDNQNEVGNYFAKVNGQLFAVIFWYIAVGPVFLLAYRLICLCKKISDIEQQAEALTDILEWIPAKLTSLLYLLVGNFQAGLRHFFRFLLAAPEQNQTMLSVCGLEAVGVNDPEILIPQAEQLVEHAVIVLLVLLALFTMVAWL